MDVRAASAGLDAIWVLEGTVVLTKSEVEMMLKRLRMLWITASNSPFNVPVRIGQ